MIASKGSNDLSPTQTVFTRTASLANSEHHTDDAMDFSSDTFTPINQDTFDGTVVTVDSATLQSLAESITGSFLACFTRNKPVQHALTSARGLLGDEPAWKANGMVVVNFAVLGSAIPLVARFGTLRSRRKFIYYTHALAIPYFIRYRQYYHATLLLLSVCHSIAHHLWPFLTVAGLNIKESAFPDVLVHMLMHLVVHCELLILGSTLSIWTTNLSWLILAASIWNTILASYSKPNEP